MVKDNLDEIFPVVDPAGNVIGKATRGECHDGVSRRLHPVVHLHVTDGKGNLYLQLRPLWKDIQPGKWDTAVGGHVDYGEDIVDALHREAREELGLSGIDAAEFVTRYVFESDRECELVNVFRIATEACPVPSEELAGGRFWSFGEIDDNLGNGIFTPNFESEWRRIRDVIG